VFTAQDLRVLAEAEIDDLLEDADIIPNINSALIEFADDYPIDRNTRDER